MSLEMFRFFGGPQSFMAFVFRSAGCFPLRSDHHGASGASAAGTNRWRSGAAPAAQSPCWRVSSGKTCCLSDSFPHWCCLGSFLQKVLSKSFKGCSHSWPLPAQSWMNCRRPMIANELIMCDMSDWKRMVFAEWVPSTAALLLSGGAPRLHVSTLNENVKRWQTPFVDTAVVMVTEQGDRVCVRRGLMQRDE